MKIAISLAILSCIVCSSFARNVSVHKHLLSKDEIDEYFPEGNTMGSADVTIVPGSILERIKKETSAGVDVDDDVTDDYSFIMNIEIITETLEKLKFKVPFFKPMKSAGGFHQKKSHDVVEQNTGCVFLNANEDASFVHEETSIPTHQGDMIMFSGHKETKLDIGKGGSVRLLGPFHSKSLTPMERKLSHGCNSSAGETECHDDSDDDLCCYVIDMMLCSTKEMSLGCFEQAATTLVAIILSAVLFCFWYGRLRDVVSHLPAAPNADFFGGHLTKICRFGLEKCSAEWFGILKSPIVTYFQGRLPVVLVADPEVAKQLLKSSNEMRSPVDLFYNPPPSMNTAKGQTWRKLRKVQMPKMYELSKTSRSIFYDHCDRVLEKLSKTNPSESIDFLNLVRSSSLDIISTILYDFDLKTVQGKNSLILWDASFISHCQVVAQRLYLVQLFSAICRINLRFLIHLAGLLSPTASVAALVRREFIKRTRNNPDALNRTFNKNAWFDWIFEHVGPEFSEATAYTSIFGIYDTTSVALAVFFFYMAKYPNIQVKLRENIEVSIYSQLKGSQHGKASEFFSAVASCKYLDWCIKETLRMFSIISFYGRTLTTDLEARSGNNQYKIPKGINCMIALDQLHHDPKQWKVPEEFRPERFDPHSPLHTNRHPFAFLPFGYGRECAAKVFALTHQKVFITRIIHEFEVSMTETEAAKNKHLPYVRGLGKVPLYGVNLTFRSLSPQERGA